MTLSLLRHLIRRTLVVSAFVVILVAPANALVCTFEYEDGVNTAFGILDATDNGDGSLTAVSGTITVTSGAAAGVYPLLPNPSAPAGIVSPSGGFIYDNQLFPAADPLLTANGLLFRLGGIEINIWGNGASNPYSFYAYDGSNYFVGNDQGRFTLECVPEPASMAAISVGVAALLMRRRKV